MYPAVDGNSHSQRLPTVKWAKLAPCSHDTALRDIQELVHPGILVRGPLADAAPVTRSPMFRGAKRQEADCSPITACGIIHFKARRPRQAGESEHAQGEQP